MKKNSTLYSIVIPAYNEEKNIREIIEEIKAFSQNDLYEIIIID